MKTTKLLSVPVLLCSTTLLFGCAGSKGDGDCEGNVWIQVYSAYPALLEVSVATFARMCDADPRMWVNGDMVPVHVAGDPQEGHSFVFTIESEGPLQGVSVSCDAHKRGIELTYIRAEITLLGEFLCECGTEEYFAIYPLEACQ